MTPGRTQRTAAETRDHVLEVAHELFYWRGIRATGVDLVAEKAGVAPTTLYRLFDSKDDLVAAYLERADRLYREWFDEAAASGGSDPARRITAVFDELREQVQPERCRGCPFLMALTEFPDEGNAGHRQAVATKAWVRRRFGEEAGELRPENPHEAEALADQLALLMEGVYASAQGLGADAPARRARQLAERLTAS
jgi:AcrR family transcriptional regulator